jgi:hypothetical protein
MLFRIVFSRRFVGFFIGSLPCSVRTCILMIGDVNRQTNAHTQTQEQQISYPAFDARAHAVPGRRRRLTRPRPPYLRFGHFNPLVVRR